MVKGSALLTAFFVVLPLLLAAAFVAAVRFSSARAGMGPERVARSTALAAAGAAAWLALTGGAASAGALRFDGVPPTMPLLLLAMVALALGIGLSPLGGRLAAGVPLAALVAVQGFRLPLELMMHQAYAEGLMPRVMSYSGRNFDIATGILAIVVAGLLAAGRLPRAAVAAWNVLGLALLLNVMVLANLAAPTPMRVFHDEPANVWILSFPWVWLPMVMVPMALMGHVVVFRALRAERARSAAPAVPPGVAAA